MPAHLTVSLSVPEHWKPFDGRDQQGAALSLLDTLSSDVAARLHDTKGRSSWSVSIQQASQTRMLMRIGLLHDADVESISQALLWSPPLDALRLGAMNWPIHSIAVGPEATSRVSLARLGERFKEVQRLELKFLTPTCFRESAPDRPSIFRLLPSPERVLSSLTRQVQSLGMTLPGEDHEAPWVYVSEQGCDLRSERVVLHFGEEANKQTLHGSVGAVLWHFMAPNESVHRRLMALLELGRFSGVGSRVAMGMGAFDLASLGKPSRKPKQRGECE